MQTEKQFIPFSETGYFTTLFINYIKGGEQLQSFYEYPPLLPSFKKVIDNFQQHTFKRELLAEVIEQQYNNGQLPNPNTALLRNSNTYTVCTGHQLCLFTGPLYFIYKIITTINLAEELTKLYPENNFIPVYWMASEDHDFEEVSEVTVFGKKIKWEKENGNDSVAVGGLKTDGIKKVIDELRIVLGDSQNANTLIVLFENAYLKHTTLADATRYLVHQLFGEYGLLVIDANDKRLKNEFVDIIQDDITNNTNFSIVNKTIQQLQQLYYEKQVTPREINVFYMTADYRARIVQEGENYIVKDTPLQFTKQELIQELESHPDRFSPNVVLRPLYQQRILPNIAYIGGPAEITYWLQYKAMFNHHQIQFPILMPRNCILQIDQNTAQQIEKLGLMPNDFFKSTDELIKQFLNNIATTSTALSDEEKQLKGIYEAVAVKAGNIDPTLKPAVEAEFQKQLNALKNIEGKMTRAQKQKHEQVINRIRKIKEKLFPENTLQERHENFSSFYVKYGKNFILNLRQSVQPHKMQLMINTEHN